LFIATNCWNILLLMLLPSIALVLFEGLVILLATRNRTAAKSASFGALRDFWRLRHHIGQQRRLIASFRQHGDFWMLRFFSWRFGRWDEIKGIFKTGFPKIG
jgi:hypothetical protein